MKHWVLLLVEIMKQRGVGIPRKGEKEKSISGKSWPDLAKALVLKYSLGISGEFERFVEGFADFEFT